MGRGRIAAALVVLVAVLGAAYLVWFRDTPTEPPLTSAPDCKGAPIMAVDLYGDLRQDDVAVIHSDGKVKRLTKDHASSDASFSPDGQQIVFTSGREGMHEECCGFSDEEIYIMNSDGGEQRRLMEESNNDDTTPAWSPDGKLIAFVRDQRSVMLVEPLGGGRFGDLQESSRDLGSGMVAGRREDRVPRRRGPVRDGRRGWRA